MMSLRLMQNFFDALDGEGRGSQLDKIAALWGADPGSVSVLRASSNFLCRFEREGEKCSLRIAPPASIGEARLEAQLDYLDYLEVRGLAAHRPLLSLSGRRHERVETPWGPCLATAFAWLEGQSFETEELSNSRLRTWGASLARLHLASEVYEGQSPGLDYKQFVEEACARLPDGRGREGWLALALLPLLEALPRRGGEGGNWGLIHEDYESDNLIWLGEEPWAIDFDELGPFWYTADLAFATRDLFGDRASAFDSEEPRFRLVLEGYRAVRPLPDEELARVPLFLALNHALHLLDITRVLAEEPQPGEAAWVVAIRERLTRHRSRWVEELEAFHGDAPLM